MEEQWVTIAINIDYEVSDKGRIRRATSGQNTTAGKILKPIDKGNGYRRVSLYGQHHGKPFPVAHLVAEAFIGPRLPGKEINHKDGDKGNNSVSNLEYVSRAENICHAFRTGLASNAGEDHPQAKVNESDVLDMRSRREDGETLRKISKDYPVTPEAIGRICRRDVWNHVARGG